MKRFLALALTGAVALLLLLPSAAAAATPAEQLATLAKFVDTAIARVQAGDVAGAQTAYKAFDDGWFDMEDGVREQSRTAYKAIEDAMSDAKFALRAEPFDSAKAITALQQLRKQCDAFINGGASAATAQPAAPAEQVSESALPAVVGRLDKAVALLDAGNVAGATAEVKAFQTEWLDIEGFVKVKSPDAYRNTENNMAKAESLLIQPAPNVAEARATLVQMKTELEPFASGPAKYGVFDAAIILLREGLEALIVIGALTAFLKKTNNSDKERWIWFGTGAGVLASIVVAFIVNLIFTQATAGRNRELIEGVTGLVAATMLIYVSYWLHSKASLGAWHRYIRDRSSTAIATNSLISLSLIAFLAVFREGAETVLFYVGIAPSIELGDLVLGLAIGLVGLAIIGVLLFIFGLRIPLRPFFLGTSVLVYYLAFKFIGTGIHALQVSGMIGSTTAPYLPENGFLGLYPTWETTAAQLVLLLIGAAILLAPRLRGPGGISHSSQIGAAG